MERRTEIRFRFQSTFWYDISPTGAGGIDAVGHYTSDTAFFSAECDTNGVYAALSQSGNRWEFTLQPPRGSGPLRPVTYDVMPGLFDLTRTLLRINGPSIFNGLSYVCSDGMARVVVQEVEYRTTGEIDRFVATIDQQCARSERFRGEIRLTRPPRPVGPAPSCIP